MKTRYVCERCGKQFDDYDECYNHEYTHWIVRRGYDVISEQLETMTEYKEGQEEPNVIHVMFERWNKDTCEYERRCGKYKLISSYEQPLVIEE